MKSEVGKQKQAFWKEHFEKWEHSGLSQRAYCDEQGIKLVTFLYYRHRFLNASQSSPLNFVSVQAKPTNSGQSIASIQLMMPNGIRLGISSEVSESLLKMVLDVAGQVSC